MQKQSPLYEIIKADVEEATHSILKDAVDPWIFFNSHGVNIKKADGSSISISGFEYGGTDVQVFWDGFADGHIKQKSRELIGSTRLKAIERNIPVHDSLQDCLALIHIMIKKIFNRMADIDQRLRGKGYPKSVKKKDVHHYIERNYQAAKALINSEIECAIEQNSKAQPLINALELKPNIFGLGINFNWLISKLLRRKNRRTTQCK